MQTANADPRDESGLLALEKLRLEVTALRRPWWQNPQWLGHHDHARVPGRERPLTLRDARLPALHVGGTIFCVLDGSVLVYLHSREVGNEPPSTGVRSFL